MGTVQGVGFRPWVYRVARELGIGGQVRNDVGGVTVEAFGDPSALDGLLQALQSGHPPAAEIRSLQWEEIPAREAGDFVIAPSAARRRTASVHSRRSRDLPGLRLGDLRSRATAGTDTPSPTAPIAARASPSPATSPTTDRSPRWPASRCARPASASTTTPAIAASTPSPTPVPAAGRGCGSSTPDREGPGVRRSSRRGGRGAAGQGSIVAVKGLGGYHLACDATSSRGGAPAPRAQAPRRQALRGDGARPREASEAGHRHRGRGRLLESLERPIVLLPRKRAERLVAPEVAPDNPLLGPDAAYTPLHHLLLAEVGPAAGDDLGQPLRRADRLRGGRGLERGSGTSPTSSSSTTGRSSPAATTRWPGWWPGAPVLLRRSRGYVPRGHPARPSGRASGARLWRAAEEHVLPRRRATSRCSGRTWATSTTSRCSCPTARPSTRMERFLGVSARGHRPRPAPGLRLHRATPWIGPSRSRWRCSTTTRTSPAPWPSTGSRARSSAWPSTAPATDRTAAPGAGRCSSPRSPASSGSRRCTRCALAGGERAIREPWRIALALLLDDAFDGDPPLDDIWIFPAIPERAGELVRQVLYSGLNAPKAHGMGGYFDALGRAGLGLGKARYEGEVALAWNLAADPGEHGRYRYRPRHPRAPAPGAWTSGRWCGAVVDEHWLGVPAREHRRDVPRHARAGHGDAWCGRSRDRAGRCRWC